MNSFHNADNLRLEVETAPGALPNLVKNPSGAKGAWGYLTPVANTNLTSDGTALRFATTVAQAAYFTTELVPVAAGRYVGARFDAVTATASYYVRARFVFYDSNKSLLSSGAQSSNFTGTAQTNYVASALAPASTAYVALRWDFYNGSAGNPAANTFYVLNNVMVTHAATSADIATSRTNLVTNPSFETNTTGWAAGVVGTIARVTTVAHTGTACLRVTQSSAGQIMSATAASIPVAGGGTYTASAWFRAATVARDTYISVGFRNSIGGSLGAAVSVRGTDSTGAWSQLISTVTAPAAAAFAEVHVGFGKPGGSNPAAAEQHYVDAVLLEETAVFRPYFDGATAAGGGKTYAWTGTAHASRSTETATASYDFVEPIAWRNILGPTHDITIEREALNVGTLSATVLDALLDPAVSSDLAPGKAVRLQAMTGSDWENLFEGRLDDADVSYTREDDNTIRTTIALSATDNIAVLANQGESRGVPYISVLPYILEGKGVPWNVNGSGNQIASTIVVSTNENASVVDQVAVTRDSVSGYAWVDRNNVLTAYDAEMMPSAEIGVNPGAEVNTTGWTPTSATVTRSTAQARTGAASFALTSTSTAQPYLSSPAASRRVYPGATYTASIWVRAATTTRILNLWIVWYDSTSTYLSHSFVGVSLAETNTGWTQVSRTVVAPDGAHYALLQVSPTVTAAGEVHYFDDASITGAASVTFADVTSVLDDYDSYTAIDAGYSTREVINEVSVNWLRPNPTSGETEEIPYGPYRDSDSIATYGPRRASFTLHGATESSATIAAFAADVLAANKTPVRKAHSLRLPVVDERSLAHAAQIDLYTLAAVEFQDIIAAQYRVTSIKHSINSEKWGVEYGFSVDGQVAAPTMTPSPVGTTAVDGVWINVGTAGAPAFTGTWVNFDAAGAGFVQTRFMRKSGIVYVQILAKSGTANTSVFTLPAGYRPAEVVIATGVVTTDNTGAASTGTAHTHTRANAAVRVDINSNGTITSSGATGNAFIALNTSFPAEA